jgi:cell fate regulator YaaT (PSP1 superfamily)
MTQADFERLRETEEQIEPKERRFCEQRIRERGIPMSLARVEHLLGGDKIVFYFLADGRVDFRQLVKDLAAEYRTRIEMRQIGVRDEARLLAEFEHCGRELCCRTFMKDLEPVTMRMAKAQKTTLDPAKISGRCGRLMCCLRFEDETYSYLKRRLPRKGTRVSIAAGTGEVTGYDILRQTVTVELPDGTDKTVPVDEILNREEVPEPEQDAPAASRRGGGRNRPREKPDESQEPGGESGQ